MDAVEGVLGLLGGEGGSSLRGLQNLVNMIQSSSGGQLLTNVGNLKSGVLKVAEMIGRGMGDNTPRTEQNDDGSFIEKCVQTIVEGRKVHPAEVIAKPVSVGVNRSVTGGRGRFGGSSHAASHNAQDYNDIKNRCLSEGVLFEDPEFPAEDGWIRPSEITSEPQFFADGVSRFDVKQGELGDCWLLAAIANLTLNQRLFHQVVPEDNSFEEDYCGIFHFRFWQYGGWVDVVVDDRLPSRDGRLIYMQSDESNEFWPALLEKAYAKLHGSYEVLDGGLTSEALEDFTGGIAEMYAVKNGPENLFAIMEKAYQRGSLMGCSIEADASTFEAETSEGLVMGHAYSITCVKTIDIDTPNVSGSFNMLRIRNPWGKCEWNGAWSDGSENWEFIDDDMKEELGLTFDTDGEFWMSYDDFSVYFDDLEICNLSADGLEDDDEERGKRWECNIFEGAWIRGATAGGCQNYESFACNPQYVINLESPDEENEDQECALLIALMQKNRRAQRKLGKDCLTIGFAIYPLPDPESEAKPLPLHYFHYNPSVGRSPTFINLREVSNRFSMSPGSYVIVPSTFHPNENGEFIIRCFTESKVQMTENDGDVGLGEVDDRVKETEDNEEQEEHNMKVREFFEEVAGDDGEIDWNELKEVLDLAMQNEFEFPGFSREVCRSMVALMDVDMTGKLGLDEFIQLWRNVCIWTNVFKIYDQDNSGHLSAFELRQALNSAGYRLNNRVLEALVLRYGDSDGIIYFDDFIMCAVKLRAMMEIFRVKADPESEEHRATFTLEEWVMNTLYS